MLWILCALALELNTPLAPAAALKDAADPALTKPASAIPWSQIGAKAGADYQGDGLSVSAIGEGARLRCVFQRLEGEATSEGLWLTSIVTDAVKERFRVTATEVGRVTPCAPGAANKTFNIQHSTSNIQLEIVGNVTTDGQTVRFTRPELVEEYSVSMDGVRQDFVVLEKPGGASVPASRLASSLAPLTNGALQVELSVTGARLEQTAYGAQLVLEHSGRKIAYSRLHVTDATGKELPARMEVQSSADFPVCRIAGFLTRTLSAFAGAADLEIGDTAGLETGLETRATLESTPKPMLAVIVNDTDAVYPIRIDPTFSDANWITTGSSPGADSYVYATVVDDAGKLYIGGAFTNVGNVVANHIAQWDGSSWSPLGSGLNGVYPFVFALAVSGSDVYAGGNFTTAGGRPANNIAKWDGGNWSALGSGLDSWMFALAVSGSDVYAGGRFNTAGGNAATNIAKWNGSNWSALGSGIGPPAADPDYGGVVNALVVSGSDVYAGGWFSTAGGSPANNIAKWDGSCWSALGSGLVGSDPFGSGSPIEPFVSALAVSGGDVYAVGEFFTAGGSTAKRIAKWDGSNWSGLSSGPSASATSVAISGSDVYVGGIFKSADPNWAYHIVKWDGSSWTALGSEMNGPVLAVAISDSNVYVGGSFTTAGGGVGNRIAKWNGSGWSALGLGMNTTVNALAVSGGDLYAGGNFTSATNVGSGAVTVNGIARWNGSNWSALGSGMDGEVYSLAVSGGDLYAGGYFTRATNSGGVAVTVGGIAKWDGSSWSALSLGWTTGLVRAVAVSGGDVYAGGFFTHVAKWNGSSWSRLGLGINGLVYALAVSGSDVYAGGTFTGATNSGGVKVTANRIAKWNGSTWSALGSGMNNSVFALAASGSDVYAGGSFTRATNIGGVNVTVNCIAKWDGSSWSALGSGMNNSVVALAASGTDLYAGGFFATAGGKVSAYVAKARIGSIAKSLVTTESSPTIKFSGVTGYEYDVQRTSSLTSPVNWNTVTTNPLAPAADGSFTFVDTNAPSSTAYYRAVEH